MLFGALQTVPDVALLFESLIWTLVHPTASLSFGGTPRLLLWLAHPLLLLSPKSFEAMQRTQADLAGFLRAHELLGEPPEAFPLAPLALGQDPGAA